MTEDFPRLSFQYFRDSVWCVRSETKGQNGVKKLLMKRKELFHLCREFALHTDTPVLEVDLNLQQMLNSPEH